MAKAVNIGKYDIKVPKDSAWRIETPPDQVRMHCLILAVAKRGGGKSVALTSLMHSLKKDKSLDRLFLVTPTFESNKAIFEGLPLDEADIFKDPRDPTVIAQLTERVENEMKEWQAYQEKIKLRRELERALKGTKTANDIHQINPQLMIDCFNFDILGSEPPKHRWNGRKPVLGVFFDGACECFVILTYEPVIDINYLQIRKARNCSRVGTFNTLH